jgi:hypothetical protein
MLDDKVRGVDQVPLPLVRHQRRDIADNRRAVREKQRLVQVHRRRRRNVIDVDPLVNRDGALGRNPVGQQHLPDRF